jgi:DNA-binding MarR family transcriptional regulator
MSKTVASARRRIRGAGKRKSAERATATGIPDPGVVQTFRRILRRIERSIGFRAKEDASCCGVTLAQCHALMEIGAEEGLSVKSLSARIGLDKSTLSRTVDGLVRERLVERHVAPDNRRTAVLLLTTAGRKALAGIHADSNAWGEDLFRRIPGSKHAQVLETMTLLADALETVYGSGQPCCTKGE